MDIGKYSFGESSVHIKRWNIRVTQVHVTLGVTPAVRHTRKIQEISQGIGHRSQNNENVDRREKCVTSIGESAKRSAETLGDFWLAHGRIMDYLRQSADLLVAHRVRTHSRDQRFRWNQRLRDLIPWFLARTHLLLRVLDNRMESLPDRFQ